MIYIENNSTKPEWNLAMEEYLFHKPEMTETVLLLWQNEPSVIVGKFQNTAEEINPGYVKDHGIHVVRRNTGGGAVYHDLGNLNFSFIMPADKPDIDFQSFTAPVVKALRSLGLPAELSGRNDIIVEGRKISGNAQCYSKGRVLHHGTLLFDSNLDDVDNALRVKDAKFESKGHKSVRARVANIREYLSSDMNIIAFQEILLKHLFDNEDFRAGSLLADDNKKIDELSSVKYETWEWNYGNSPPFNMVCEKRFPWGSITFQLNVTHGYIDQCRIYGDFFGNGDINEFAWGLIGLPYGEAALRGYFSEAGVNTLRNYIHDAASEDLMECLF